jgi:hypothetical protein
MEKLNQLIEIVYDRKKRKLRARCIQDGRWVRFPNKLRVKNKVFSAGKMKTINGSHWTASDISEFDLNNKNEEIEKLLGLKNKGLLKKFYNVIISGADENKINTEMLNIIFTVKGIFPEINEQLLEPLIKTYSHSAFISEDLLLDVQNLLISYNEKRVVSIFSNYEEDDFLEDTVIMYKQLFENDISVDEVLPPKPKNIREFHTIFTRESSKIKQPKHLLKQDIDFLDGIKLSSGHTINVPKTTLDLIDIGNSLCICVGNGYYAKKVLKKQCRIISLKLKNEVTHCVEFGKTSLIQCRGRHNRMMDDSIMKEIKEVLFKKNKDSAVA